MRVWHVSGISLSKLCQNSNVSLGDDNLLKQKLETAPNNSTDLTILFEKLRFLVRYKFFTPAYTIDP